MHFLSIYTFSSEKRDAVIARFKETGGAPPEGIKMLSRWHDVAGMRGYTVSEAKDPIAMSKWALRWTDLMKIEIFPVLNDEQLVKALSS